MKVKQGKIMLLSLIAAFITFFSLSLSNLTAVNIRAEGSSATQSATALTQKTYGIDWEGWYGKDGYVVIGDASGTYYSDMQEGNDGTTAIADSNWTHRSNELSSFTPKANAPISTLTFGTIVWAANNDLQTYNLYKPGTNKTERLKTRAHQNNDQKYYADVFAGFTLKGNSDTYVTLNVSDHNRKVSEQTPITISVYASGRNNTNGEAYANNQNPERYMVIDEFYAGKGGKALATATVTQQSANVTFKLAGAGEYRVVAYYNNPTALDENGAMVTTGTNSPLCPQINGFFFDADNPLAFVAGTVDYTTSSSWQGVYGNDGYVIMDIDQSATAVDQKKIAYTKGIYNQNGTAYTGTVAYTDVSTKYNRNDTNNRQPEWKATDTSLSLSNALVTRYGLNADLWEYKTWLDGSEATNGNIYSENQLKKPDSDKRVTVRVGGPNKSDLGASSFAFTVSENAVQNGPVFVTVYNNNSLDGYADNAAFDVKLYNQYYSSTRVGELKGAFTASAEAVSVKNTHFYTTFEIRNAGDWTISIECTNGVARGAIQAVFFDKVKPAPATTATFNIQYVVEGGTNSANNPSSYTFAAGVARFEKAVSNNETAVFEGWYQDEKFTKPITSVPAGMNVDLVLYAKFVAPCTISYNVGDGTNNAENPKYVASGESITLKDPVAPARHYFDGWYTTENFDPSTRVTDAYNVTGDVTFYAKFTEVDKYTITYVLDGGTNSENNPAEYYSGEGVAEFAPATKDGYTFEGWYFDEEFDQEITMIPSAYTQNVTLYAKFEKNVVVSNIAYVLDGGTNAATNPATYTEGETVTLAAATKDGYTFDGWYTDSAFTNKITEISSETNGDVTLYAKFTKNQSEDSGDSSGSGDSGNTETPSDSGSSTDSGSSSEEKKGCGGSIALGAPMLALLAVGAVVATKKKKED